MTEGYKNTNQWKENYAKNNRSGNFCDVHIQWLMKTETWTNMNQTIVLKWQMWKRAVRFFHFSIINTIKLPPKSYNELCRWTLHQLRRAKNNYWRQSLHEGDHEGVKVMSVVVNMLLSCFKWLSRLNLEEKNAQIPWPDTAKIMSAWTVAELVWSLI